MAETLKSPSQAELDTGGDPYKISHITDWLEIEPIESTYRTKNGGPSRRPRVGRSSSGEEDLQKLFVHDKDRLLTKVTFYANPTSAGVETDEKGEWQFHPSWARRAGPRAWIYFNPPEVRAAIVTCGGLCPGINDVVRQIVYTLDVYGVKDIQGVQYGFKGFVDPSIPPIKLDRKVVHDLNQQGGSFLGVSRGHPKNEEVIDKLEEWGVSMLFIVGGNGSHAGANAIHHLCCARKMKLVVVGVPKTIDNDILLIDKTFGFDTAVEEAHRAIEAAYVEASSAYNGVGIVKLMGRQSGYIAMHAALANGQVDVVLIPEVPFVVEGEGGVMEFVEQRVVANGNCLIVLAEGAGQDLLEGKGGFDASGNPILGDIGKFVSQHVKSHFKARNLSVDVKYIDPTYMIRARPPNSADHILCTVLGQNAVHGAFAGYSNVTIGLLNTHYAILPIPKVIQYPRTVDPNSNMWHRCVTATGQPDFVQGLDHTEDNNRREDPTAPLQDKPPKAVEEERLGKEASLKNSLM